MIRIYALFHKVAGPSDVYHIEGRFRHEFDLKDPQASCQLGFSDKNQTVGSNEISGRSPPHLAHSATFNAHTYSLNGFYRHIG